MLTCDKKFPAMFTKKLLAAPYSVTHAAVSPPNQLGYLECEMSLELRVYGRFVTLTFWQH